MINIKGLDKAQVLLALWNHSKGMGNAWMSNPQNEALTLEEAAEHLSKTTYVDYIKGRVIKCELGEDTLDPRLYDRDNGNGAALQAIERRFGKR